MAEEITFKLDVKELMKDLREEMRLVFEAGWQAGNSYAMCVARDAEDDVSVMAIAWAEFEAKVFSNG